MDQGSYTYFQLADKYKQFEAPGFEIQVDGKTLKQGEFHIPSVEVEISAGGAAGGCSFTIEGMYDYKNSFWENDSVKLIKPGAKLAIKGGETKTASLDAPGTATLSWSDLEPGTKYYWYVKATGSNGQFSEARGDFTTPLSRSSSARPPPSPATTASPRRCASRSSTSPRRPRR